MRRVLSLGLIAYLSLGLLLPLQAHADIGGACTNVADCGPGWVACTNGQCYNSGNCRSNADCIAPQTCGAIQPDSGNGQCAGGPIPDPDPDPNPDPTPVPEMSDMLLGGFILAAGGLVWYLRKRRALS